MMIHNKNSSNSNHHRQSHCCCYATTKWISFIRIRSSSLSFILLILLILLHVCYQHYQTNYIYYDIFVHHQRQIIVQEQLQGQHPNDDKHYQNADDGSSYNMPTNISKTMTTPKSLRQGIASFIATRATLNEQQLRQNDHSQYQHNAHDDDKNDTTTTTPLFWNLWEQYRFRYSSYYYDLDDDDIDKDYDHNNDIQTKNNNHIKINQTTTSLSSTTANATTNANRMMIMKINPDIRMNLTNATSTNATNNTNSSVKRKRKQIVWNIPNYNLICNTILGYGIEGYDGYQLLANKISIYHHDSDHHKDYNKENSNKHNQNHNNDMQKRSYLKTNISTITSSASSSVVIESITNITIHNNTNNNNHSKEDSSLNQSSPLSYHDIHLFCGIYTYSNMYELARSAALTWGKDCHGFIAFTNETIEELGFIQLHEHMNESYYNMWQKTRCILKYIYEHYLNDYDYFHIGGDDMYVIIPNLLYFLSNIPNHNHEQPLMFGQWIRQKNNPYISGGPGYTLNKYAIIYYIENQYNICYPYDIVSYEDRLLSYCLSKYIYDSRDPITSEQLYHDVAPDQIYTSRPNNNTKSNRRNRENFHTKLLRYYETLPYHNYYQYNNNGYYYKYIDNKDNNTLFTKFVGPKYGLDAASQYSISFHRLYNPEYMIRIHSILYPNEICLSNNSMLLE